MPLPLVFRRKVGRDLADAFAYYDEQVEGLGERYLGAVDMTFDAIERYPEMFARVLGEVRRAIISQFPYAVFYRIEQRRIQSAAQRSRSESVANNKKTCAQTR